jgi:hypothetical protein
LNRRKRRFYGKIVIENKIDSLERSLLKSASDEGWKSALKKFSNKFADSKVIYADDEYRILWRFLLPLTKNAEVLYIGCDWGIQLENLARQVGNLTVGTSDETKLAFLEMFRDQCGLKNIHLRKLDDTDSLRKKESAFDILVLDGYSKWPASQDRHEMWPQFHALLKEGGCVLCNTDLKGWAYKVASKSSAKNSLFKDLPPAQWLSSRKTFLASISRMSREYMFQQGFEETRTYLLLPHYRDSKVMVPLDSPEVFSYFIKSWARARKHNLQNPIIRGLVQFLSPLWKMAHWSLDRLSPSVSILAWKVTH